MNGSSILYWEIASIEVVVCISCLILSTLLLDKHAWERICRLLAVVCMIVNIIESSTCCIVYENEMYDKEIESIMNDLHSYLQG